MRHTTLAVRHMTRQAVSAWRLAHAQPSPLVTSVPQVGCQSISALYVQRCGCGHIKSKASRMNTAAPLSSRGLEQHLGKLVREGEATEAVQCLREYVDHHSAELAQGSLTFPWGSLSTTLFICEARAGQSDVALGLTLVDDLRQRFPHLIWDDESVLSVLLRLHAAADHVEASQRIFHFLLARGRLKGRSGSAFLQLVCRVGDLERAAQVWRACVARGLPLTMTDYEALGQLCVARREPLSTLHELLQVASASFTSISPRLRDEVMSPWIALQTGPGATEMHRVRLPSPAPPLRTPGSQTESQTCCPACGAVFPPYTLTCEQRASLVNDLLEKVVNPRCQSQPRAHRAWAHWMRFLQQATPQSTSPMTSPPHHRFDVLIDGANVGYYGLSAWYDTAKATLESRAASTHTHRGRDAREPSGQHGASAVDVGVDLELIDEAVRVAMRRYGFRKPLIFLHERHLEPRTFLSASGPAIVQRWRANGMVYCVPRGINDDWCWLHAALTLGAVRETPSPSTPLCILTNDEMRDHHFQLLHPVVFTRWRAQHQIRFRCQWRAPEGPTDAPPQRELVWSLPPSFATVLQICNAATWHIPVDMPDDVCKSTSSPAETHAGNGREWVCVTNTRTSKTT